MAEPLKTFFGPAIPRRLADQITAVFPDFPRRSFLSTALHGYESLELLPRGRHLARALRKCLPQDYPRAIEILLSSLGPVKKKHPGDHAMAPFFFLPHVLFVAEYGLDHFDVSMRAQYELTQRFTAEFSIRPFLERYPEATLARLRTWSTDSSPHVRRLVSEGTRPRLPWAARLQRFQQDPRPVLSLLETLKDDPSLYVRRSVANNLNDIGKDHPALLVKTARAWLRDATETRRWVVHHALRSAIKRGDRDALEVLGVGHRASVAVRKKTLFPSQVALGQAVTVAFELHNLKSQRQQVLVDFRIHFVKFNGATAPKVFKLRQVELAPGSNAVFSKRVALVPMTTRTHYPGRHRIELLLNGRAVPFGSFHLVSPLTA